MPSSPADHMIYKGETVTLKRLECFKFGKKRGYTVYAEYDGIELASFKDYWELDDMLEQAGHGKPTYQYGAIIELADVQAVLKVQENQYRVGAIYKMDDTSTVTRDEIIQAQTEKRKVRRGSHKKYEGLSISERIALAQKERYEAKQADKQAEMDKRFAHGEKLIRFWLGKDTWENVA